MTRALVQRLLDRVVAAAGNNPGTDALTAAATQIVNSLSADTGYVRATINLLLDDQHPDYYHLWAMAAAEPVAKFAPQALVGALVAAAAERVGGRVAA